QAFDRRPCAAPRASTCGQAAAPARGAAKGELEHPQIRHSPVAGKMIIAGGDGFRSRASWTPCIRDPAAQIAPDDRLREAIHSAPRKKEWIASAPLRKRFAFVAGNDDARIHDCLRYNLAGGDGLVVMGAGRKESNAHAHS
ncbi:MAG: hypothetical protein WB420_23270, partial [Bradyrhizobium sp.]